MGLGSVLFGKGGQKSKLRGNPRLQAHSETAAQQFRDAYNLNPLQYSPLFEPATALQQQAFEGIGALETETPLRAAGTRAMLGMLGTNPLDQMGPLAEAITQYLTPQLLATHRSGSAGGLQNMQDVLTGAITREAYLPLMGMRADLAQRAPLIGDAAVEMQRALLGQQATLGGEERALLQGGKGEEFRRLNFYAQQKREDAAKKLAAALATQQASPGRTQTTSFGSGNLVGNLLGTTAMIGGLNQMFGNPLGSLFGGGSTGGFSPTGAYGGLAGPGMGQRLSGMNPWTGNLIRGMGMLGGGV